MPKYNVTFKKLNNVKKQAHLIDKIAKEINKGHESLKDQFTILLTNNNL